MNTIWRWIRGTCLCGAILCNIQAAEYVELTAEIELNDWSYWFFEDRREADREGPQNNPSIFQEPLTVRCVIGANNWLMEGQFFHNAIVTRRFTGSNIVEQTRVTQSTKFTNVFKLKTSIPSVGHEYTRTHETLDGNPGRPVRVEDLFPDTTGKICWLAFCSGPALKREDRRIPVPSALWKQFYSSEELSDKTVAFEDALGLPREIQVFANQERHVLDYQVRSQTNLLGWNFPLEFYLVQYRPARGGNSSELHLTAKGKVTSIKPRETFSLSETHQSPAVTAAPSSGRRIPRGGVPIPADMPLPPIPIERSNQLEEGGHPAFLRRMIRGGVPTDTPPPAITNQR